MPLRASQLLPLFVTVGAIAGHTACGHTASSERGQTQTQGPSIVCPSGSQRYGRAPPAGKLLFCADLSLADEVSRNGPAIEWGCSQCRRGASLRGHYVRGKRDGVWTLIAADGKRLGFSRWHAGRRVGESLGWYDSGTPQYRRNFDHTGRPDGLEWSNYPDGKREFEGMWRAGKKHGRWRRWTRSGRVVSDEGFDDGVNHGVSHTFDSRGNAVGVVHHARGVRVREGQFVGGLLQLKELDAAGNVVGLWSELNGQRHGTEVHYYQGTQTPQRKSTWARGVQTGPTSLHRKDGSIRATGMLRNGTLACGWRLFDRDKTEITRGPIFARLIVEQARKTSQIAASTLDPCRLTTAQAMALAIAAEAPLTFAIGRWLMEQAAASPPPAQPGLPPSLEQRLAAMQEVVKRAHAAAAALAFDRAAILHVAALLEADRALAGALLQLPRDTTLPGSPTWSGPVAAGPMVAKFRASAAAQMDAVRALLYEDELGDRDVRKAGRVVLGRLGIDKLTVGAFSKRLQ